jgi:hypothetical protein
MTTSGKGFSARSGDEIEPHDIGTLYDATNQSCHSEQREESLRETLRCAQGDIAVVSISCGLIAIPAFGEMPLFLFILNLSRHEQP